MATFINLTQHDPMPAQVEAGVTNLPAEQVAELKKLLTFNSAPTQAEMQERAEKIAALAKAAGADRAMIGGAAYSMPALEEALEAQGITPTYAFTAIKMETVDGKPQRTLEHKGLVDAIERNSNGVDVPSLSEVVGEKILNLTKFPASKEQQAAGVAEPSDKKAVQALVEIPGSTPPAREEIERRAQELASLAAKELEGQDKKFAMIGGLPLYMVGSVESALQEQGIKPVHSFTKRIVVGEEMKDGKAVKKFDFVHEQFVESGAGKNPKGLGNEGAEDLSAPDRIIARN